MDEVETKLKEVEIASDQKENRGEADTTTDKVDKKKRKGKKKSKVESAKTPEVEKSEANVLQEIEKNQPENEENEGPVCASYGDFLGVIWFGGFVDGIPKKFSFRLFS